MKMSTKYLDMREEYRRREEKDKVDRMFFGWSNYKFYSRASFLLALVLSFCFVNNLLDREDSPKASNSLERMLILIFYAHMFVGAIWIPMFILFVLFDAFRDSKQSIIRTEIVSRYFPYRFQRHKIGS